ncbi:retron system putative HNH endonuclease [Bifidobacterium catulorum]
MATMLLIEKADQPLSLVEDVMRLRLGEKRNPGSRQVRYDNLSAETKRDVQRSLLSEQRGLCAYCMGRITLKSMHIEHYHAQHAGTDSDDELSVRYDNMLAVCDGGRGLPYEQQTCDTHRRNDELSVNPWNDGDIRSIRYGSNGEMRSERAAVDFDIQWTLNLNEKRLVRNRRAALCALQQEMAVQIKKGRNLKVICRRYRRLYEVQNPRREYAGILLDYLSRKINK